MTFEDVKKAIQERDENIKKALIKQYEYAFDSLYFRYEKAREKQYDLEKELAHLKGISEPAHQSVLRDKRRFYEILSEFLKTEYDIDERN